MSKAWSKAPAEFQKLAGKVMSDYHKDLDKAGVALVLVMVDAGMDASGNSNPAILKNGIPRAAMVKRTTLIQKILGMPDAVLQIDFNIWEPMTKPARVALVDHQLEHLALARDKDGKVVIDGAGRPVLEIVPHDTEIGIFHSVIERHGMAAIDAIHVQKLYETKAGQMVFEFVKTEGLKPIPEAERGLGKHRGEVGNTIPYPDAFSDDTLLDQAKALLRETGRASTSMMQRRLRIGYTRASVIMDKLEEAGIIGPPAEHGGLREILQVV